MGVINDARAAVYNRFISMAGDHAVFSGLSLDRLSRDGPGRLSLAAEEGPRPDDSEMWIRLVVRHVNKVQESLGAPGNRRFRHEALILVSIFVPLNRSSGPVVSGDEAAEAVEAIFGSTTFQTANDVRITTYASIPKELPPDGPWYPMIVETPMTYDERA